MTMSFKKTNVTLDADQLQEYMELAWRTCWEYLDKQPADAWKRQDYVTASDIETCVRWLVDRDNGEAKFCRESWWGHNGWCRIKVTGGRPGSMLSRCQTFLYRLAHDGQAVGHNFNRGHISGARYRRAGSDVLNEKELKTLTDKKKEKPVHLEHSDGGPACTAGRRNSRWRYRFNPKGPRTTSTFDKVNCPRCMKILRREEELNPMPDQG